MIEPVIGDRVRFATGGRHAEGVIVALVTAGRAQGRGIWALRRRARIRYDAGGHQWETHRDLSAIALTVENGAAA